jgi:site-specific DNA-methyltransferase (cytosine-N4-specific)
MTRLSRIHPYPAMIADNLAIQLSEQFVEPGQHVLDPFCGTGRTLLAAMGRGAECVGIDVNPLAALITRAKSTQPRCNVLENLLASLHTYRNNAVGSLIDDLEPCRKVDWFSPEVKRELSTLIHIINQAKLKRRELDLIATILSATVREVSYCRNDQWKLHRISSQARKSFFISPLIVFERRLRSALQELAANYQPAGMLRVVTGDTRKLSDVLQRNMLPQEFDVILTSPPYGDSRTTVQYGGMSGISLGILRHLHGIDLEALQGGEIDRRCLGGQSSDSMNPKSDNALNHIRYWRGGDRNPARQRVHRFLSDMELCCREISSALRRGGWAVFVVARRTVGGWRLHLDRFIIEVLKHRHMCVEKLFTRQIEKKMAPRTVNSHGRSMQSGATGRRVITMREEYVLVFRKA